MFAVIRSWFGKEQQSTASCGHAHTRTSSALKSYDVCRKVVERGVFVSQERTIVCDRIEAQSVEQATLMARRHYGHNVYVVLMMD